MHQKMYKIIGIPKLCCIFSLASVLAQLLAIMLFIIA
jgi:hypothetical protein